MKRTTKIGLVVTSLGIWAVFANWSFVSNSQLYGYTVGYMRNEAGFYEWLIFVSGITLFSYYYGRDVPVLKWLLAPIRYFCWLTVIGTVFVFLLNLFEGTGLGFERWEPRNFLLVALNFIILFLDRKEIWEFWNDINVQSPVSDDYEPWSNPEPESTPERRNDDYPG